MVPYGNSLDSSNKIQYKKEEDHSIQINRIMLRDKFSELSKTLEEEISNVVQTQMIEWQEENLPSQIANFASLDFSQSTIKRSFSRKNGPLTKGQLPSREFIPRPSPLNELLAISHFRSVYNIFGAILFVLFLQELVEEVIQTGKVDMGQSFFFWAFGKFDRALFIWLCMKTSTLIGVYLVFHFWAYNRHRFPRVFDVAGVIICVTYLFLFLKLPTQSLLRNELPPATSLAVLTEQIRLFMKTWAFIRSNIPRVLNFKKDDNQNVSSLCPNFSQYLYFLFVPTLVYRDEYPRNNSCNWRKVCTDFLQVIGCIIYMHFLLTRFCAPVFHKFGHEEFTLANLVSGAFSSCFPASLMLLCAFFLLLHAWMNAFAEMLTFADRMFYKDWWTSTSFARFYRKWNCVVHDWLYEYIYRELSNLQPQCSYFNPLKLKFVPMLTVFFTSAFVHEYILAFSFRFFYPVLFVMFGGIGTILMFINTRAFFFNLFIWVSLILGTGILMCLYSIEWYARINCPPVIDGFADYFVPRSWFCVPNTGS